MPQTVIQASPGLDPHDANVQGGRPAESIWVNTARMHGEPCFAGTRVPVQTLFDHLRAGDSFEKFLAGYEGVRREQVIAVIDLAAKGLVAGLRSR